MSKATIAAQNLVIRNETRDYANTNGRVADVLDDINNSKPDQTLVEDLIESAVEDLDLDISNKMNKPTWGGTIQYYIVKSDAGSNNLQEISISTNRVPFWSGSTLSDSPIYINSGRVGIGAASTSEIFEVTGNAKVNAVILPPNSTSPIANRLRGDGTSLYFSNNSSLEKKIAFDADKVNVPTSNGTFAIQQSGGVTSLVPTFSTLENLFFDQNGKWAFPNTGATSYSSLRTGNITQMGQSARTSYFVPVINYTFNMIVPVAYRRGSTMYFNYTKTFKFTQQFDINSSVATTRLLVGLSGLFGATNPTNVSADTLTKTIGVCKIASSSNLAWIWNDATGSANIEDMGASFPANDFNSIYRLTIENTNIGVSISLKLERINKTTGTITSISKILTSDFNIVDDIYPILYCCDSATTGTGYMGDYGIIGFISLV